MNQPLVPRLGIPISGNGARWRLGAPPARLHSMGLAPRLGQSAILDNRLVSLFTNAGAAAVGVVAGSALRGPWSTISWIVAVVAGFRAVNDLSALTR